MSDEAPALGAFIDSCDQYLSARYSRKATERRTIPWGEGNDRVAVFDETDSILEATRIDR